MNLLGRRRRVIDREPLKSPVDLVKEHYSDRNIIKLYLTVGLWPSESRVIEDYFVPGSSVLDIGCGAGRTSIAMAQKKYNVTGIDFIPEMISAAKHQAAQHKVNVNFMVMDAVNLDLPAESFQNAFFSFNGFEQIPHKQVRERVLENVWTVLKPDGCFILTARSGLAVGRRSLAWIILFFRYFLQKTMDAGNGDFEFGDKVWKNQYHHYLNPYSLRSLACRKGFQNVYFNSSANLEKEKKPDLFTNFSNDKTLFYVLKKRQSS